MSSGKWLVTTARHVHLVMEEVNERDTIGRKTLRRVTASAERRRNMVDMVDLFVNIPVDVQTKLHTKPAY